MAADNMVTLVGNIGTDPQVRRTSTGRDVVSFNLVTNDRVRDADGRWTDGAASWFKVSAWDDLGRNAAMSFRKGQRVIARGTLKVQTWQARDGSTGKTVELTARSLGHDLLWGTTSFVKTVRPTSPPQQQPEQQRPAPGWGGTEEGTQPEEEPAMALAGAPASEPQWSSGFAAEDETPF
jgi:single-strand DNA-binding protein